MDDPPIAMTNAPSTAAPRLFHRAEAARDVGSTSMKMLRVGSTTDTAVMGRAPVPRHDGQRPARSSSDPFEDCDERRIWRRRSVVRSAATASELPLAEVLGEVTHAYGTSAGCTTASVERLTAFSPRLRTMSNASSTCAETTLFTSVLARE